MSEAEFTILDSRSALVRALQVLRYTPEDRLSDMYKAVYGYEIEKSSVRFHAAVGARMFEMLLNDFDERYKPELIRRQAEMDSCGTEPECSRGSECTHAIHP